MKAERQQKETTSHLIQLPKGYGRHIVDNRPQVAIQAKLINSITSTNGKRCIQCYPQKGEGETYFDSDYPGLVLVKLPGYHKYKIQGTDYILYFEYLEGYYLDELLTTKADMSLYTSGDRPGISNLGGKSYYFRESEVTEGYLTIEAALGVLENFCLQNETNRQINMSKVESLYREFNEKTPVFPIQVRRGETGYELIQGRHRIYASWKRGYEYIPYNVVT